MALLTLLADAALSPSTALLREAPEESSTAVNDGTSSQQESIPPTQPEMGRKHHLERRVHVLEAGRC